MARKLYSFILYLLTPFVVARLLWRSLRAPAYRQRIGERFGYIPFCSQTQSTIWIHAVSVGEVRAAVPLVQALRKQYPQVRLLLTTTTPTGAATAQSAFTDSAITHRYAPYDLPAVVDRFLDRANPHLLIILETELWPNWVAACQARAIPVVLVNARLSGRSVRGYQRLAALTQQTLRGVTIIAAQSKLDADRFLAFGAYPIQITVTGNLKFDQTLPKSIREEGAALRAELGVDRPVWIAASTHTGEEAILLAVHAEVRKTLPDALLLLVPRHPERFAAVAAQCRQVGFSPVLWSEHRLVPTECAVYLGDTMGRLLLFYAAADVAFVGGSLVPVGGHNPLEPAALGIPLLFGSHRFNFAEITDLLLEAGAAHEVKEAAVLTAFLIRYLKNKTLRHRVGERGQQVVEENRGALATIKQLVDSVLV